MQRRRLVEQRAHIDFHHAMADVAAQNLPALIEDQRRPGDQAELFRRRPVDRQPLALHRTNHRAGPGRARSLHLRMWPKKGQAPENHLCNRDPSGCQGRPSRGKAALWRFSETVAADRLKKHRNSQ